MPQARRYLALLALLVSLALPATAQTGLHVGLRAGATLTDPYLEFDSVGGTDFIETEAGFLVAGQLEYRFSPLLAATLDAGFARTRYSYSRTFTNPNDENDLRRGEYRTALDFARVGLLLRVSAFEGESYRAYVLAGPRLDLLVNTEPGEIDLPSWAPAEQGEDEFIDFYDDTHLSGVAGVGVALDWDFAQIQLEGRYSHTLNDITSDSAVDGSISGINFTVGVLY